MNATFLLKRSSLAMTRMARLRLQLLQRRHELWTIVVALAAFDFGVFRNNGSMGRDVTHHRFPLRLQNEAA
jgi:hypothetical protein